MQTTDLNDLTSTVEALRKERYPDLDARFLEAVVRAEDENPEDDADALRAIQDALKLAMVEKGEL